jgi:hypothetical protein
VVETDLTGVAGNMENPPQGYKVVSHRYFTVAFAKTR